MHLSTLSAFIACGAIAAAFKDTSPYLFFSTAELPSQDALSPTQIQSAAEVLKGTKKILSDCPSEAYIIVSQPGLSSADLESRNAVPFLRNAMLDTNLKTRFTVSEVLGGATADELKSFLISHCGASDSSSLDLDGVDNSKPVVIQTTLTPLPAAGSDRKEQLADNDASLQSLVQKLSTKKYTLIYTSTPPSDSVITEEPSYEPLFQEPLHMDLKRQSGYVAVRDNSSVSPDAPLFEKYQFFTPGLFMGLFVSLVLLSILSVAIKGLSSLQVSYGAFDKEMGPAAQKKVQ